MKKLIEHITVRAPLGHEIVLWGLNAGETNTMGEQLYSCILSGLSLLISLQPLSIIW